MPFSRWQVYETNVEEGENIMKHQIQHQQASKQNKIVISIHQTYNTNKYTFHISINKYKFKFKIKYGYSYLLFSKF